MCVCARACVCVCVCVCVDTHACNDLHHQVVAHLFTDLGVLRFVFHILCLMSRVRVSCSGFWVLGCGDLEHEVADIFADRDEEERAQRLSE